MAIVGYARVSTIGQNLDVQLEKFRKSNVGIMFGLPTDNLKPRKGSRFN